MSKNVLLKLCIVLLSIGYKSPLKAQNTAVKNKSVWQRHVIDNLLNVVDSVRLADVNNDGLKDITTGWEEVVFTKVYLHPGHSKSKEKWPSVIVGKTPSVEDAVFADLNNDGAIDVISSTEDGKKNMYINWATTKKENYLNALF